MTKVIFDVNCLGHSVGDKAELADTQAERLIRAGAAHEEDKEPMFDRREVGAAVTKPAEPTVTKGE